MRIVTSAVIAVALLLGGCSHAARRGEDLFESLRTYHEGVRWERFPAAAARVPAPERSDFVEERDRLAEDLRISDYEIVRVASHDERRAKVQVKYTWYLDSEGIVRHTHAMEGWERHGKVWLLVEERLLRGDAMPGLPGHEGDEAAAGAPEAAEPADPSTPPSGDDAQAAPGP
jgi:hypothetical protein